MVSGIQEEDETSDRRETGEEEEEDERDGSTGKAEPEITGVSVPENQAPAHSSFQKEGQS